jgi:prolyl 4-hydroxylase
LLFSYHRNCRGLSGECQSPEPLNLELEVISTHPRAFIIDDFLSEFESEEIIRTAEPMIHQSQVGDGDGGGARVDSTRTSWNAWLKRDSSPVISTLHRRAADLLNFDEKIMYSSRNSEDLQVVHYVNGQKYDSHHDWGVSGYPESRYITLLLYLTEPEVGGETSFPKAADGLGIKVKPKKGMAMLFYNLLEDGNGDELSLHAALPVFKGEKWLANFWVWDPKRK